MAEKNNDKRVKVKGLDSSDAGELMARSNQKKMTAYENSKAFLNVVRALQREVPETAIFNSEVHKVDEIDKRRCLACAAARNYVDLAKKLISLGATVNLATPDGTTPLHLAAANSSLSMVRLLVDHGADINAKVRGEYKTPLDWAVRRSNMENADYLRKKMGLM